MTVLTESCIDDQSGHGGGGGGNLTRPMKRTTADHKDAYLLSILCVEHHLFFFIFCFWHSLCSSIMHTYIYTLDAATPYNLFHHLFVLSPLLTHVLCLIVAFTYGSLQLFCSIFLILRNILLDNSDGDWSASFPLWEISFVTLLLRMLMT